MGWVTCACYRCFTILSRALNGMSNEQSCLDRIFKDKIVRWTRRGWGVSAMNTHDSWFYNPHQLSTNLIRGHLAPIPPTRHNPIPRLHIKYEADAAVLRALEKGARHQWIVVEFQAILQEARAPCDREEDGYVAAGQDCNRPVKSRLINPYPRDLLTYWDGIMGLVTGTVRSACTLRWTRAQSNS